jgi:hypothetical protein
MENNQRNQSTLEITLLQDVKGLLVGSAQRDPEVECVGCQRMWINMGVLISTLTFELETLSQHRHLIEGLQDEIYAQRSQIEEQRSSLEIMQSWMDQMERNHQQHSTPTSTQGASKNVTSATVNQIPDLNEPCPDPIWE